MENNTVKNLYVISGVTGMTGNELGRRLIAGNNIVIGFDNFFASSIDTVADLLPSPRFIFHQWDINDSKQMDLLQEEVNELRRRHNPEQIVYINCAAVVHTEHFYKVEETFSTNVTAMRDFLQRAIDAGAATYINCSTSEVYSMQSWNADGGVKESDFLVLATAEHSQRTSYAVGKLMTEFFLKDAVEKGLIRGCSIRFANVYSKHERFAKHIIPHIINQLISGSEIKLLENSRVNKRTFLHNYDSCQAVIELMNTPSALDGSVYNVATDEEISIVDLAKKIAAKMGVENPRIVFEGYRASDPERRVLSTEKIRTRTAWKPTMTLDSGLDLCIASIERD